MHGIAAVASPQGSGEIGLVGGQVGGGDQGPLRLQVGGDAGGHAAAIKCFGALFGQLFERAGQILVNQQIALLQQLAPPGIDPRRIRSAIKARPRIWAALGIGNTPVARQLRRDGIALPGPANRRRQRLCPTPGAVAAQGPG